MRVALGKIVQKERKTLQCSANERRAREAQKATAPSCWDCLPRLCWFRTTAHLSIQSSPTFPASQVADNRSIFKDVLSVWMESSGDSSRFLAKLLSRSKNVFLHEILHQLSGEQGFSRRV